MKRFILALALIGSIHSQASGLFADGFQPSNWGEAISHVGNRIRSAHSSGSGNVDVSALGKMTTEQWESKYMYIHSDESLKENDPRKEVLAEYEELQQEIFALEFNEKRREEILDKIETEIGDLERRISKGLHYYYNMDDDACIIKCHNNSDFQTISCLRKEVEKRVNECETYSVANPYKYYCNHDAKKGFRACYDDGWDFQTCQADCLNR